VDVFTDDGASASVVASCTLATVYVPSTAASEVYCVSEGNTEDNIEWSSSEEGASVGNDDPFIGMLFSVEEVDEWDKGIDEDVCGRFCEVTISSVGDRVDVEEVKVDDTAAEEDKDPHSDDVNGESIDDVSGADGFPSPVGKLNW